MDGACERCLRHSWLLSQLSAMLDYRAADEERLLALFELSDDLLIEALAGSRKGQLRSAYRAGPPDGATLEVTGHAVCIHDDRFPARLRGLSSAPRTLHLGGGLGRLSQLLTRPTVAIVGTRRASDYGMLMGRELARGLARCGVTIVVGFAEGIARAVGAGVLEAGEPALVAMAGGVEIARPASQRALWRSLGASGCLLSELGARVPARRWCEPARERIIAGLCDVMVVVEASGASAELRVARMAERFSRPLGALPGRLTSRASDGSNALIASGARLIRGPEDILDMLALPACAGSPSAHQPGGRAAGSQPRLANHLRAVLDRVGAGEDTLARLTAERGNPAATMAAVGELELLGLLVRGDGGRYLVRR